MHTILDIILCLTTLMVGAIFSLYSKPMSDWRDGKEQSWKMNGTNRSAWFLTRVKLYRSDQHAYTQFLIDLTYRLVMSFGCMILGTAVIILAFVVHIQRYSVAVVYGIYALKLFGALLYGFGFTELLLIRSEHKNYLRASQELRKQESGR